MCPFIVQFSEDSIHDDDISIVQLHYPKAKGPKQSSPAEVGSNCQSIEMA